VVNSTSYDKAIIYKALSAMPREQLRFMRDFFVNFVPADDELESMTEAEYRECLAIIQNTTDEDWFDLDCIDTDLQSKQC